MNDAVHVRIWQKRQSHDIGLGEQIRLFCHETPPVLAWAEPQISLYRTPDGLLHTGRHPQFTPLVTGCPQWPEDLSLTEARLFWPNKAIHLVASGTRGCVSVTLFEAPDGDQEVVKTKIELLTLRDAARFGLRGSLIDQYAGSIEYRRRGRLLAWRLVHLAETKEEYHHE